jgi:polygalacturonase
MGGPARTGLTDAPEHARAAPESGPSARGFEQVFDVSAYGAAADGRTRDTAAIQAALDACAAAGGGRVVLPGPRPGSGGRPVRYRSGTVRLRDRVELHIDDGAVLEASTDPADYPDPAAQALITADGAEGLSLTGHGALDGRALDFMAAWTARPPPGCAESGSRTSS